MVIETAGPCAWKKLYKKRQIFTAGKTWSETFSSYDISYMMKILSCFKYKNLKLYFLVLTGLIQIFQNHKEAQRSVYAAAAAVKADLWLNNKVSTISVSIMLKYNSFAKKTWTFIVHAFALHKILFCNVFITLIFSTDTSLWGNAVTLVKHSKCFCACLLH